MTRTRHSRRGFAALVGSLIGMAGPLARTVSAAPATTIGDELMPRIRPRVSREVVVWVAVAAILVVMQWPMLKGAWYKRTGAEPPTSAILWHTELDTALAEAARLERPILVDFAADWCPPCITMKHDVWPDPAVVAAVRDAYVPLLVDVDRLPDIAAQYGVSGIPSVMVLDEDGQVIKRASYLGAPAMVRFLKGDLD